MSEQPAWVQGRQPAGGRSKWHLLSVQRVGPLTSTYHAPDPQAPELAYALSACGFVLADYHFATALGPSRRPEVLLPVSRGQVLDPYGSSVCARCFEVASMLASSQPAA